MKQLVKLIIVVIILVLIQPAESHTKKIRKETQKGFLLVNKNLVWDSSETQKYYDKEGHLIEEIEKSIWQVYKRLVVYRKKYFYSSLGKLDSILIYTDDKLSMKLIPSYDTTGKEIEVQEIFSNGTKGFKTISTFDSLGNKVKSEMYNMQGKLYNFKNYKYDNSGNLIEEAGSQEGVPKYRWKYTYDSKKHLVVRQEFDGRGKLIRKRKYEYGDSDKIKQETVLNMNGKIEKIIKYTYEYYEE